MLRGHVNFVSTIIANNDTVDCDLSGSYTDTTTRGSYNLITDLSSCGNSGDFTDTVETDPMLSDLANNGGDTETMELQSGSPAIDAGSCDSAVVGTTDQRGYDRAVDGDSDGTETCDIGAYEKQVYSTITPTRFSH